MYCSNQTYVLIGDKTVVSKAGKTTYGPAAPPRRGVPGHFGLDRFFSSIQNRPIKAMAARKVALLGAMGWAMLSGIGPGKCGRQLVVSGGCDASGAK